MGRQSQSSTLEQLQLTGIVAAAGRHILDAVLDALDREIVAEDAQSTRYLVRFHERTGCEYETRVSSREGGMERAHEAFGANCDIDFVDIFAPSGDWLMRVGRTPMLGRLIPAPASDAPVRQRAA